MTSPSDWRYCRLCVGKGAVPECPLCRALNGRDQTEEEAALLLDSLRADWDRLWEAHDAR